MLVFLLPVNWLENLALVCVYEVDLVVCNHEVTLVARIPLVAVNPYVDVMVLTELRFLSWAVDGDAINSTEVVFWPGHFCPRS